MIQNKLMKIKEYPDGDSYWRIACDCGSPEHDINLWFDANADDKRYGVINLNLSMEIGVINSIGYNFSKRWNFMVRLINIFKWRISMAFKILFIGHCTMSGDVILDLDGIQAMQTALNEGLSHAKKTT